MTTGVARAAASAEAASAWRASFHKFRSVGNSSLNRRPCSASAAPGAIQIEIDRLAAVVRQRVAGRGERQEEVGVEALGQKGRGDPAGEGNEGVGGRREALARHEVGEGRAAVERAQALR